MSLRLILVRHAKSSWDDPTAEDHDRPLNKRGRTSAGLIGTWLEERGHHPHLVLSSTSVRTRETLELIAERWTATPEVEFEPKLYLAAPNEMLDVLRTARAPVVMMLGHNPGCALSANALATNPPPHARFEHYPTGAVTVMDIAAPRWETVDWGGGEIVDFVVPRDLAPLED